MSRGLIRSLLFVPMAVLVVGQPDAAERETAAAASPILQRFLTADAPALTQYRAFRHLEAHAEKRSNSGWMDVWTEADRTGFRYRVVAEGGSEAIRSRAFRGLLDAERKAWGSGARERSSITLSNYTFEDPGAFADGLAKLSVRPRRKDSLLVNGAIFVKPGDGDLVRMEGQLAKAPSFWTRRVEIVRRYERFHGVRLPVALESVANVLIYGRASLTMTYEYESVNGQRVGTVQLHAAGGPAHP